MKFSDHRRKFNLFCKIFFTQSLKLLAFEMILFMFFAGFCFAQDSSDTIDIDVRDANLRDVFTFLANKANINVLLSPKIHGTITCRVSGMEPSELIEFIARANGFTIEDHGRILLILAESLPSTRMTFEVIPLMNADSAEVAKIIEKLKIDKRTHVTHDARGNRLIIVHEE